MSGGKLRGACIGAGYFSRFHYSAWNRILEVEIVPFEPVRVDVTLGATSPRHSSLDWGCLLPLWFMDGYKND